MSTLYFTPLLLSGVRSVAAIRISPKGDVRIRQDSSCLKSPTRKLVGLFFLHTQDMNALRFAYEVQLQTVRKRRAGDRLCRLGRNHRFCYWALSTFASLPHRGDLINRCCRYTSRIKGAPLKGNKMTSFAIFVLVTSLCFAALAWYMQSHRA